MLTKQCCVIRLVPPSGELDETYASSLILSYFLHYINVIHKTGSTQRIALPSEEDQATTRETCRKVGEICM